MMDLKQVLLAEDGPNLKMPKVDGLQVLRRLPVDFPEFMDAIKELGLLWAVVNQPPPASLLKGGLS